MTDTATHRRSSRHLRSILLVPAILLGIAACGDDSNSSSTTAAAAAPPPPHPRRPSAATAAHDRRAHDDHGCNDCATTAGPSDLCCRSRRSGHRSSRDGNRVQDRRHRRDVDAGDYTFNVTNGGSFPHNLIINGPRCRQPEDREPHRRNERNALGHHCSPAPMSSTAACRPTRAREWT